MPMMKKIYKVINQMPDQSHLQAVVNLEKNWSDEYGYHA